MTVLDTSAAVQEVRASTLAPVLAPTLSQRVVDRVAGWLSVRTSRRGFLARAGVVGSALAVDPVGYVLRPGTAYASVCGPGSTASSGWTVFCATINKGVNACPPGSIAAGWWKADGASLCGGSARYIVDCNATCSRCSTPGARAGICSSRCWSCGCTTGPSTSCDRRKNCCNAFRYGQCNTQVRQVGGVQCRVVSCTPPWKWERCSTAPATDNRTRDHSSDALPVRWTALTRRYRDLGENGSVLGNTVYREFPVGARGEGRAQRYERGRMSWSQATGARETVGPISTRYVVLGGEGGSLGYPTGYPGVPADRVGRASRFQRGRISWHPETGAWETRAHITLRYERDRAESGELGYPVGAELVLGDRRGRASRFQGGRISWHPTLGAFLMRKPTADRYAALGAEDGLLGYPVADERTVPWSTGHATPYQRGRISWHPHTGAWETRGDVAQHYVAHGAERGVLRYPTAGEQELPGGGRVSTFQHGRISVAPGGTPRLVRGPIAERYVELGAELGALGYPLTDEYVPAEGQRRNDFERGKITYDEASGEVRVEPAPTASGSGSGSGS